MGVKQYSIVNTFQTSSNSLTGPYRPKVSWELYRKWESELLFEQKNIFFLETAFFNAKGAQLCYPIVSEWDQCQDEFHFKKYHRVNAQVQRKSKTSYSRFFPFMNPESEF